MLIRSSRLCCVGLDCVALMLTDTELHCIALRDIVNE
eukprot:COSAG06_NODE_63721_length_261_cov_1.172840_1_plen_36_part_01